MSRLPPRVPLLCRATTRSSERRCERVCVLSPSSIGQQHGEVMLSAICHSTCTYEPGLMSRAV